MKRWLIVATAMLVSAGVFAASDFRFLTINLPQGSTNAVYAATLLVANAQGPVTFGDGGTLRNGLTIDPQTGFITGRPTVVEQYTATLTANDGVSTVSLNVDMKINASGGGGNQGVTFATSSLPQGRVGTAYDATITISNAAGAVTFGAQDLPPGLSFNGLTGVISGAPSAAGTFFVSFTARDAGESNTVFTTLPLTVLPVTGDFHFTTLLLNNGQVSTAFTDTWTTANPAGTVVYSASGLPPGLTLNTASGQVTGTPATAGTFLVILGANDGTTSLTMNRTMWIAPSPTSNFYWDFFGVPAALLNQSYTRQPPILVATKNPAPGTGGVVINAIGFPEGITYNTNTGEISGTPIEVGVYPVTITATASGDTITVSFDFNVLPPKGGDINSIPANFWAVKQSVKKAGAGKDSWSAQYIYNANRSTGKAFNPASLPVSAPAFVVGLGSRQLSLNAGAIRSDKGKFTFKSASGLAPAEALLIDPKAQSIKLATKSDTFTDTFPSVLRNTLILGNKGYKVDESYDAKGVFVPALAYRKAAFVVSSAVITAGKGTAKDGATLSMLLADPNFDFIAGSTLMQFRILTGTDVLIDKTFTTLAIGTGVVDPKTSVKVFKLKNNKDASATNNLSKFTYDSKTGKLALTLKGLTLGSLTGAEKHVAVEFTVGDKVYTTAVTLFAPKAGSYSTKMP